MNKFFLQKIAAFFRKPAGNKAGAAASPKEDVETACCSDQVHIAFRGVSDERLYIVYGRRWHEVQFYKANGLKVFCAQCRRRVF